MFFLFWALGKNKSTAISTDNVGYEEDHEGIVASRDQSTNRYGEKSYYQGD